MPLPLSIIARDGQAGVKSQKIWTTVAPAEMLLSSKSATAVSSEYPRSRIDAERAEALGGNLCLRAITHFFPAQHGYRQVPLEGLSPVHIPRP